MAPSVLHLITRFARGGSEQRVRDIIAALPEFHHVVVVGRDSDVPHARATLPGAEVRQNRALVRQIHPRWDAAALGRVVNLLRREPFAAIYTHQSKAGVVGRIAARLARVQPAIHSLSMANFGDGYPSWQSHAFRSVERQLARWTAAYVAVGADLADRFQRAGVPGEKLHVVRSGAPLPRDVPSAAQRRRWRNELDLPVERPVVAYVGSLDRRKNVLRLPDLLAELPQPRPVLAIAGEGPQAAELSRLLEDRDLSDCVRLLGYVTPGYSVLAAADVVILPSTTEGLPQVLLQSTAVGTPWVSFDVDGARELIDMGAAGTVVASGDIGAAALALRGWMERDRPDWSIDLTSWSDQVIRDAHRRVLFGLVTNEGKAAVAVN